MLFAIGLVAFSALFLGVMVVARSPNFWFGLLAAMTTAALPFFAKRNTPEIEEKMKQCTRMGGTWDNFNKVCRFK